MTTTPIAFQTNIGRFSGEGVAQVLNGYAEKRGDDAKAPLSVLAADGMVEFAEVGTTPCRGLIYLPDLDKLYSVHSNSVYKITYSGGVVTVTRIGTIPGDDPVQLSRNQNASPQIIVRCNAGILVIATDSVAFVTDSDLPDEVVTAECVNNYTLYGQENRTTFYSGINDSTTINSLDFFTFEQKAGKLVKIVEDSGEMYGFGDRSLEVWRPVNNPDLPFAPISFQNRGLMAFNAVLSCDNTLMFPGNDGIVYRLENYQPQRISTHHIERLIQADTSQSDILGFSWSRGGHAFANLTGTNWSRCYDAATGVWHSRQSYGQDTWRARYSVPAWGKTIVGDRLSGKLFYLDSDTYTEDGGTMIWGVDSPPLHVFPNGARINAIHLDIITGEGTLTGQGSDPKLMLQTSTDGGSSFGNYRELELGVRGKRATRVTARKLGRFGPKGLVIRLRISDPVARGLLACDVNLTELKR